MITPLVSTGDKRLVALRFDGDVEAVVATDNHPYWVQDAGWVAAGDLVVGDTTLASDGTERVLVQTTDLGVFTDQTVHNLHVAGEHTYYVTANASRGDQLVHNAKAPSCPVGGGGRAVTGTVLRDRGVRVVIHSNDHAPWHAHVIGRGPSTKIGRNGKPIDGGAELSRQQAIVIRANISTVRRAMKLYIRFQQRR